MSPVTNSPYVFTTERGGPLSVGAMEFIVREAGKRAGLLVETLPHMLRHAAGYAPIMLAMRRTATGGRTDARSLLASPIRSSSIGASPTWSRSRHRLANYRTRSNR